MIKLVDINKEDNIYRGPYKVSKTNNNNTVTLTDGSKYNFDKLKLYHGEEEDVTLCNDDMRLFNHADLKQPQTNNKLLLN